MEEKVKISMFGISGSGKTCYLYAMAQILQGGARKDDFRLSVIANDMQQQAALNKGYMEMVADGRWPDGTNTTTDYDLRVRVQRNNMFKDVVPNLTLFDYAGGVWTNDTEEAREDRRKLMEAFAESSSLIFIVDGYTLLQAMNPEDRHPDHKDMTQPREIVAARQKIAFVENLFMSYKRLGETVPPVMVVITKSDVFIDDYELQKGKALVKEYLPSIFAHGCGVIAAITNVSLGSRLGSNMDKQITGQLSINTDHNIHLPLVYAVYAYLDERWEKEPNERAEIEKWAYSLRNMMNGKVELFKSGSPLIAL